MKLLSQRASQMAESETLAMTKIARQLQAQGKDIINLSIGEPDFNTPESIKIAAQTAINENWTHYPPVAGYADLREAICQKLKRDNHLTFLPSQIVVSTGAKQSIFQLVMATVNPQDEVIIPAPYWVSYREIVGFAGGKCVFIKTDLENDFKVTPQQIEAAITPRTKLIMFSSPSNPTGMLYNKTELEAIAQVLQKYPHVLVMADEIYEHINFTGKHESLAQFEPVKDQVIVINGVAKGYAMTGWRIGYLAAPLEMANACEKLQGQITSATCSIAQRATIKAMELDPASDADICRMRQQFLERRDLMYELLAAIQGFKIRIPQGAFYFFPDISHYFGKRYKQFHIENSADLCTYLLYESHVALVAGTAFGDDNCIRLSYATDSSKLIEAARRIKEALGRLQ
jgi:aspartate aminotransferase